MKAHPDDEVSRAAFEAWYCFPCENTLKRSGDSYGTMAARVAWRTWQAATAAACERLTALLTEQWHNGEGKGLTLAQYLGMSANEYAAWVVAPNVGIVAP